MKKIVILSLLAITVMMAASDAHARGRVGSIRVGGYSSSGLGSTYIGGY